MFKYCRCDKSTIIMEKDGSLLESIQCEHQQYTDTLELCFPAQNSQHQPLHELCIYLHLPCIYWIFKRINATGCNIKFHRLMKEWHGDTPHNIQTRHKHHFVRSPHPQFGVFTSRIIHILCSCSCSRYFSRFTITKHKPFLINLFVWLAHAHRLSRSVICNIKYTLFKTDGKGMNANLVCDGQNYTKQSQKHDGQKKSWPLYPLYQPRVVLLAWWMIQLCARVM